jgi:hypothetical protein
MSSGITRSFSHNPYFNSSLEHHCASLPVSLRQTEINNDYVLVILCLVSQWYKSFCSGQQFLMSCSWLWLVWFHEAQLTNTIDHSVPEHNSNQMERQIGDRAVKKPSDIAPPVTILKVYNWRTSNTWPPSDGTSKSNVFTACVSKSICRTTFNCLTLVQHDFCVSNLRHWK